MTYSKSFKKCVITVLAVLTTVGSAWAGDAAKKTRDRALQMLPADTLFCVRVNNLDSTCTAVNEYLKGVAPESFDVKEEVLSKLVEMLGSNRAEAQQGHFSNMNRCGEETTKLAPLICCF